MEYTQLSPVVSGFYMGKKTPLTVLRGARTSKWRVTWGIFGQTMGVGDGRTSNG